jgi:V8-like Glu-specific endopeptidase
MKILSSTLLSLVFFFSNAQAIAISLDPKYDFNGIVKLKDCSGSIIKFSGMPDSAKAIVMTNGHCLDDSLGGPLDPNTYIANRPALISMKVYNQNQALVPINATKVLYATMTKTDVTLYELKESYTELTKKGVAAFDLDTNHPALGTSIDIISGYWDRGYRCNIDAFIYRLKEADWTMNDSIRYSNKGCNTIGGTSGAPLIETGTRSVIGINNTGNDDGERCTMDNPCEVDEEGKIEVRINASYGQQTYEIYSCLTLDFRIDLGKFGCGLFR